MADLLILALTVFTFQNNIKIAINIHLLEIFALLLVFFSINLQPQSGNSIAILRKAVSWYLAHRLQVEYGSLDWK